MSGRFSRAAVAHDLSSDLLLHGVYVRSGQGHPGQIGCRLDENCVHLVAGLCAHIVLVHFMLCCETTVLVLFDGLHVIEVNFVTHEYK